MSNVLETYGSSVQCGSVVTTVGIRTETWHSNPLTRCGNMANLPALLTDHRINAYHHLLLSVFISHVLQDQMLVILGANSWDLSVWKCLR